MLTALKDYAVREKLVVVPGLKPKTVRWLLKFSPQGQFLGVQDLTEGDRKSKGREFAACPDLTQPEMAAIGGGCRHFLVDSLDNVCVLTKDGEVDDKLTAKHTFFIDLLDRAQQALWELGPINVVLRDDFKLGEIRTALSDGKAKPTDLATFAVVSPSKSTVLVEDDRWQAWWQAERLRLTAAKSNDTTKKPAKPKSLMRCLLSGELVEPKATHNKIDGLASVGGRGPGDSLVSFDKDAFSSYGLEQGENAAMSEMMVKTYSTALNHLIRNQSRKLAGVKVVYWYSHRVELDPMEDLFGGEGPQAQAGEEAAGPAGPLEAAHADSIAARLLSAFQSGEKPELGDYRYYALTLSANSGRVVIRDWMEGPFTGLLEAVNAWFNDIAIPLLGTTRLAKPPSFEHVLTSGLRERPRSQSYEDWARPATPFRMGLWKAALGGERAAIPRALVEQIVSARTSALLSRRSIARPRRRSSSGAASDDGKNYRLSLLYTRLGAMRAYCNRFARTTEKGDFHVDTILDVSHPRSAYHVGRLMAVLEMIQSRAQGKFGATIAQTYYAAAATRPISALPRLETLVQHHIPKIKNFRLRQEYLRLLTEISLAIGKSVPRTFDLEDQCVFHLGYYHQRAYRPFEESPKMHLTLNGDKVRSKSEVIVANLLTQLKIPYEYETRLRLKAVGTSKRFNRIDGDSVEIRPDFTIRQTKDGRPIFIEHLGMMDNFAYRNDWDDRKDLYAQNDILPVEKGGGANGSLAVTGEGKGGAIDCQELLKTLGALI